MTQALCLQLETSLCSEKAALVVTSQLDKLSACLVTANQSCILLPRLLSLLWLHLFYLSKVQSIDFTAESSPGVMEQGFASASELKGKTWGCSVLLERLPGVLGQAPCGGSCCGLGSRAPSHRSGCSLPWPCLTPGSTAAASSITPRGARTDWRCFSEGFSLIAFPGVLLSGLPALDQRVWLHTPAHRGEWHELADACCSSGRSLAFTNTHKTLDDLLQREPQESSAVSSCQRQGGFAVLGPAVEQLSEEHLGTGLLGLRWPQPSSRGGAGGSAPRSWVLALLRPDLLSHCSLRSYCLTNSIRVWTANERADTAALPALNAWEKAESKLVTKRFHAELEIFSQPLNKGLTCPFLQPREARGVQAHEQLLAAHQGIALSGNKTFRS